MQKILFQVLFIIFITSIQILAESNKIIIDVQDYGAEVNDDIDDYYAIQRAIAVLDQTKSGKLIFHKGVYNIRQHKTDNNRAVQKTAYIIYNSKASDIKSKEIPKVTYLNKVDDKINYKSTDSIRNFTFSNYTALTIEGNGAIFDFDGDWTRTADYTISSNNDTYSRQNAIGIEIINSTNVLIRNLELDGNANETIKEATAEGFSNGIMIGGSSYVTIDNVYAHHYHSDGLYIYATKDTGQAIKSEYINVSNSRFKYNARQGCSIVGARYVYFRNCAFSNTGNTGGYGSHLPSSGVDIEPHYDVKNNGNISFSNCNFIDNLSFAYIGSDAITTPYPVEFNDCTFSTNGLVNPKRAAVAPSSKKTYFTNCFFNEVSMWPNYGAKDRDAYIDVNVYNCTFKSRRIDQKVLFAYKNKNLKWYIRDSSFQLNSTSNDSINTQNRFYITNNKQVVFQSNTIEMIEEEYQTYNIKPNVKFILHGVSTYSTRWIPKLIPIKPELTNSKYGIIYHNGVSVLYEIP